MSFSAEKAFTNRIVVLSGEEEALRRRFLTELIDLATRDGDFDLQTFEGDSSSPHDWLASAGTAPFLSEKRTVVVRHVNRSEEYDILAATGANLPSSAFLVLVLDDEGGDEDKQRRAATRGKNWEKAAQKSGGLVLAFTSNPKQIKDAIKAEVQRLGKKISDVGAETLAEMTGSSLSRSIEELEKLALYVGDEPQIRESDIKEVVLPSREWNIFNLIDAVVSGSPPEALRHLRILMGSNTKAEEAAFSRILPMLNRQLRLMWQARICIEAKTSAEAAPPHIASLFPEKPNLAKESPYRQSRLAQQARRVDLDMLAQCFAAVDEADSRLKGLLSSFSGAETLESMVLSMIQIVSPKPALRA